MLYLWKVSYSAFFSLLVEENNDGYVTMAQNATGLSAEEEALVASMMGNPMEERRTLADIIMEKIEQKEYRKFDIVAMVDFYNLNCVTN